MCGIAGIVDFERPAEASRSAIAAMQRALARRGPDGQGDFFEGAVALGHTRLAIQDSESGAQPLLSPDGRHVLVYNGELANADELRRTYAREFPFNGKSDTEVVLAALTLDGVGALRRFSGMFALFLWDREQQRGVAARDTLGVKPLLYTREGSQLRFASEAKALIAARGTSPAVNMDALVEWALVPQFSGVDRAPFAGVEILPPGGLLEVDRSGVRVSRWSRFRPASKPMDEAALLDDVLRRLYMGTNSVAASDWPTGVFLSGGLDSSLIAEASGFSLDELRAYTIRFEGQDRFDYAHSAITFEDDTPFAEQVAKELELEHTFVDVRREALPSDLETLAKINDLVPAWEQELAQHHLSRVASQSVKVVLIGDAADETHFGYHFLLDPSATKSIDGLLARLGAPARLQMLNPELRASALETLASRYRDVVADAGQRWGTRDQDVLATTALIVERWLPRLLHNGDVHTMAFGLEARVPFCSANLLDLAERVTPAIGLKNGIEKWHLRQGAEGDLPKEILWRRKSALPKDQGAEPVYRAEAERLLADPDPLVKRLLDVAFLRELARAPRKLLEVERSMLFQAIVLTHWARHHGVR